MDKIKLIEQLEELTPPICSHDKPETIDVFGKSVTVYCKPFEQFQSLMKQAAEALMSQGHPDPVGKKGPVAICSVCGSAEIAWDADSDTCACLTCGWTDNDVKGSICTLRPVDRRRP